MADEFNGYPTGYPYGTTPPPTNYGPQGAPTPNSVPYYPYPSSPQTGGTGTPGGGPGATSPANPATPQPSAPPLPAVQASYIENILRLNKDKQVTVYMTFEHAGGSESKAFVGNIEAAGRDHLILKDNKTNARYLLPLIYLDYVQFQGVVAYSYPYR